MKRFTFIAKSFVGRLILFLSTLAFGIAVTALFLFDKASRTDSHRQLVQQSPQTFEQRREEIFPFEIKQSEGQINSEIVQSSIVDFPVSGRVIVEAVEEIGKFPQMIFISEKTGEVLLRSSIEDKDRRLIPAKDSIASQPELRFNVVRSSGFKSPMIMSVGVYHGGSDNAYYLSVFGEVKGKIRRLNDKPLNTAMQGGYYLGYLNKKFGYGLAVWSFTWGSGKSHYSDHKYDIEIYQLRGVELKQIARKVSRKTYDTDKGFQSLQEFGIKASDQRLEIPKIGDDLRSNGF